jgi:urease accessory protein
MAPMGMATITTISTTTMITTITARTGMAMIAPIEPLLRLQTWLSPAFPIGAFSYSHGLEYAVEAGLIRDRATAADWIGTLLVHGTGRSDGMLLAAAYRAEDDVAIEVAELGAAFRGTAELARESAQQGAAFVTAVRSVWPCPELDAWSASLARAAIDPVLPVAVGAVCRLAGISLDLVLPLYLQAFAANLVSAAVRLVPLGQTDGLRIVAALESMIPQAAASAASADLDEIGTATPMLDWCSMRHETQYTRLFRS